MSEQTSEANESKNDSDKPVSAEENLVKKKRRSKKKDGDVPSAEASPGGGQFTGFCNPDVRTSFAHLNGNEPPATPQPDKLCNKYPKVVIPELKILNELLAKPSSKAVNGVKKLSTSKPRKKKDTDATNVKTSPDYRSQYGLLPVEVKLPAMPQPHASSLPYFNNVEVRLPHLPLSQIQSYTEAKRSFDEGDDVSHVQSTTVNGAAKRPRKSRKSVVPPAGGNNQLNGVEDTRPPPPRKQRKNGDDNAYAEPYPSTPNVKRPRKSKKDPTTTITNTATTAFINASTPKTLAEGYSVIAVPDMSNVPTIQPPPPIYENQQLVYQEQSYHPTQQVTYDGNVLLDQQYASRTNERLFYRR
jgi:hypothetical protein